METACNELCVFRAVWVVDVGTEFQTVRDLAVSGGRALGVHNCLSGLTLVSEFLSRFAMPRVVPGRGALVPLGHRRSLPMEVRGL